MEDEQMNVPPVRRSERLAATRKLSDDIKGSSILHKKAEFDMWFGEWVEGKNAALQGIQTEYEFYRCELPILLDFQKQILAKYRLAEEQVLVYSNLTRYNPSIENNAKKAAAEEIRKYIHTRIRELYRAIRRARDFITPAPVPKAGMIMKDDDDSDRDGEDYKENDEGILNDILMLCKGFDQRCSVENSPACGGRMSDESAECSDIEL